MANYATLKAAIQQVVKTNGNNEITGALLQQSLLAMINSLGSGYQYVGVATPSTNPGTPDQNVFYIAATAGAYSNFGSIVLADGEVAILKYNGSWSKDATGVASEEKLEPLYKAVNGWSDTVTGNGAVWYRESEKLTQGTNLKLRLISNSGSKINIYANGNINIGSLETVGATVSIVLADSYNSLYFYQGTAGNFEIEIGEYGLKKRTENLEGEITNIEDGITDLDEREKMEFWGHPYPTFVRGTLYAGTLAPSVVYRVATDTIMEYDRDVILTADDGFHFGIQKFVGGSFLVDTGWQTKYTVYKGETFKMVIARTVDDTSEVADIDTFVSKVNVTTLVDFINKIADANLVRNPFAFNHFVYHSNLEQASPYVPSQSLFDIAYAKKLGYEWMEVNPRKCSDGVFVCKHGGSGDTLGVGLTFTDGTLSSNTLFSNVSSTTLRQKAKYASIVEKYQTHIPTLDEFCAYAKEIGIKLIVQCVDRAVLGVVRKYFSDDSFIAYGLLERGDYKGYCYEYISITSAADALVRSKKFGYPYILCLSNFSNLSEVTFKEISAALHQEGNLVAAAYLTGNQMQNALSWGIDLIAVTDTQTPHLKNGNTLSLINDSTGLEMTGGATFSNGVFDIPQGGKINLWRQAYETKQIQCTIRLVYDGSLDIRTGFSGGLISSLVSDGTKEIVYSALSLYSGTVISIVAASATKISNLQFILEEIAV